MQITKMTNVKVATSSSYLYSVCTNFKKTTTSRLCILLDSAPLSF